MTQTPEQLFQERLGRYQRAIALEAVDRVPIAVGSNTYAETYSGISKQEVVYAPERWLESELKFCRDFPEVDVLRNNRFWVPLYDMVGLKTYKFPGRDLPVGDPLQFVEDEYMLAEEYDDFISSPATFMMEKFFPRIFGEMGKGSARSHLAFLKAGLAQARLGEIMRNRGIQLQTQCGMPQPVAGAFMAPMDALGDVLRGMVGILKDTRRCPDKLLEACEVMTPIMIRFALATADPLRRYPIFVPTHKPTFMSPRQFDQFYWPSFKKTLEGIIAAGHKVRCYLEGDWSPHWHHFLELPKGSILLDIDDPADNIFKAKKEIGHHMCLAGGIASTQFILSSPEEMDARVKRLCEECMPGGGYILSGSCYIPSNTRPENYKAMVDAALKYGWYDRSFKPEPLEPLPILQGAPDMGDKGRLTPWSARRAEFPNLTGNEELIQKPWESFEDMAFLWMWNWAF
nr:uroporphyrinogen decarboxylase family protein [uncultured Holophaga sp.]